LITDHQKKRKFRTREIYYKEQLAQLYILTEVSSLFTFGTEDIETQ